MEIFLVGQSSETCGHRTVPGKYRGHGGYAEEGGGALL